MKKLASGLAALMFVAMGAQAQDDCMDGATIDSSGNDCMKPPDVYVRPLTMELTPQQHAEAVQQMARNATLAKAAADKKLAGQHSTTDKGHAGPQAAKTASAASSTPASPTSQSPQDGQCAGNSDATGNACK